MHFCSIQNLCYCQFVQLPFRDFLFKYYISKWVVEMTLFSWHGRCISAILSLDPTLCISLWTKTYRYRSSWLRQLYVTVFRPLYLTSFKDVTITIFSLNVLVLHGHLASDGHFRDYDIYTNLGLHICINNPTRAREFLLEFYEQLKNLSTLSSSSCSFQSSNAMGISPPRSPSKCCRIQSSHRCLSASPTSQKAFFQSPTWTATNGVLNHFESTLLYNYVLSDWGKPLKMAKCSKLNIQEGHPPAVKQERVTGAKCVGLRQENPERLPPFALRTNFSMRARLNASSPAPSAWCRRKFSTLSMSLRSSIFCCGTRKPVKAERSLITPSRSRTMSSYQTILKFGWQRFAHAACGTWLG